MRRLAQTLAAVLWDGKRLLRVLPVSASPDARGVVTKQVARAPTGAASLQDYAYVARGLWRVAAKWQDDDLGVMARDITIVGWQRISTLEQVAGACRAMMKYSLRIRRLR